jgi:hypothetical protein
VSRLAVVLTAVTNVMTDHEKAEKYFMFCRVPPVDMPYFLKRPQVHIHHNRGMRTMPPPVGRILRNIFQAEGIAAIDIFVVVSASFRLL